MKITANRKEEILKRKAEYEAARETYDKDMNARWSQYQDAVGAITDPVKTELEYNLGKFSALQFQVRVEEGRFGAPGIQVRISCDENRKFEDHVALAWSYNASLIKNNDGQYVPMRETSSWSGLSATTPEQMESLQQTVKALDYLNSIDWAEMLNKPMPDAKSFYKDLPTRPEREDFEAELNEDELEDLIGQPKLIRVQPFESSGYRGSIYVQIVGQTPAQYIVKVVPASYATRPENILKWLKDWGSSQRVKKSNLVPIQPIDIVDIPEVTE